MCGIIGIIPKKEKIKEPLNTLDVIKFSLSNKHRGESDGFGMISSDDGDLYKNTWKLTEIEEFLNTDVDDISNKKRKKFKKKFEGLTLENEDILKPLLFHHRKATCGKVELKNCHPFKIKNKNKNIFYLHNGSLSEKIGLMKNFFTEDENGEFDTDLDSELLAFLAERKIKKNIKKRGEKNKFKGLLKYLEEICHDVGVLIRVDYTSNSIIIIKDESRSLYCYETDEYFILISEPIPQIDKFKNIKMLKYGIFSLSKKGIEIINEKGLLKDCTEKLNTYHNFKKDFGMMMCDSCKSRKVLKRKNDCFEDYCLDCFLNDRVKEKKEEISSCMTNNNNFGDNRTLGLPNLFDRQKTLTHIPTQISGSKSLSVPELSERLKNTTLKDICPPKHDKIKSYIG